MAEHTRLELDLAMLVKRLVRRIQVIQNGTIPVGAKHTDEITILAIDFLNRNNIQGSILR